MVLAIGLSLQSAASLAALGTGLYAGFDLLFGVKSWSQAVSGVIARGFLFVVLSTVGIDQLLFGQNAVLQVGYAFGLPLVAVQVGFAGAILIAIYFWTDR
jgi:hypothetical protein